MLKQANEREERGHREVEKQRNFLLTCQAQIQALKNTTDVSRFYKLQEMKEE